MSSRQEAVKLYKRALRVAKNWKALNESNTETEKSYIKNTIRNEMERIKTISIDQDRSDQLLKLSNWLDICIHYRIPYSKPYYFSTGVFIKQAKAKIN